MSRDNFSTVLFQMFDEQKDCDIKFTCPDVNDSSGKSTIGAHKLILSIASEVFYAMFYGSLVKSDETQTKNVINIPDIKILTFKKLLR